MKNEAPKGTRDLLAADRREPAVITAFKDGNQLNGDPVTELDLRPMSERRERTQARMAHTVQELERLRTQREELERDKNRLEILEQRQVTYEKERRNLRDRLVQRMALLRKLDLEATRRAELFAVVRHRFDEMLREVDQLIEQQWTPERYQEELNRALAILDDIDREVTRAWSRVEAVSTEALAQTPAARHPVIALASEPPSLPPAVARRFVEWLRIGAALSLPLIVALLILLSLMHWLWNR